MRNNEIKAIIDGLDKEWDIPDGFFYLARSGIMDVDGFERVIGYLSSAKRIVSRHPEENFIERDLVKVIWPMTHFLIWQEERICQNGFSKNTYSDWISRIEDLTSNILGMP